MNHTLPCSWDRNMIINIHFVQSRELFVPQAVGKHLPLQLPHPFPPGFVYFVLKTPLVPGSLGQCKKPGIYHGLKLARSSYCFGPKRSGHTYSRRVQMLFHDVGFKRFDVDSNIIQRQRKQKTEPFYLIFRDNCLLSLKFYWIILVSFWSHNHRNKSYQCEILQPQQYVWVRVWLSAFIYHSLHSKFTVEISLIPEPFLCLVDHRCKEISFKSIIALEWIPAIFWGFLRGTHFPLYISLHTSTIGSPILVKSALA